MKAVLRMLTITLAAMVSAGVAASAAVAASNLTPYLHAQRLVDVGGYRLNLYCTGRGSPSVILDAGEGNTSLTWRRVQPAIARFARVCSFDRAGTGFSESGPLPRDANAMVRDLHALLLRANVAGPYVLVGHSIAGLYAPLYADRYPSDVAGMVLVDPSFPNQTQALHAVSPTLTRMTALGGAAFTTCYRAAQRGELGIAHASQAFAPCGFPPTVAADVNAACAKRGPTVCRLERLTLAQYVRPAFWAALRSEDTASYTVDSAENLRAQRGYGAMPLIVLTAANDVGDSPVPAAEMRAVDRVWNAGHEQLARRSSVGVNEVVSQSGHDIQLDRPAVVTGAIAEVVSQAKR